MTRTDVEVLVVGAGPAGCAVAMELARRGRDVRILERAWFPRDKPCGDCVNPGAVAELSELGVANRLRRKLEPSVLRGWRVEAPDGRAFQAGFGRGPDGLPLLGWAVRRREFDAALLEEAEHAGARAHFGVRVNDVLQDHGNVVGVLGREGTVAREFRARHIVGADGLRSVVRRRLGLERRRPRLRKIALVGHLAEGNGSGSFGELRVRHGRVCGYARLGVGANLTLVIPQHEAPEIAGDPRGFLTAALSDYPDVRDRVERCGLESEIMVTGPFDLPVNRPWTAGAVLVGDAAGYYDPFTGQGIYQALHSGRLASRAIDIALRDPSDAEAALRSYGRAIRRAFGPKRALQRVIEAAVNRPGVMSRFVRELSRHEVSAARLLRATGDVAHPATLLHPLLWARMAFYMARATNDHS